MTKYPNRVALYEAHNIYRDAMREFIPRCLKKVQGTTPEELISEILKWESIDNPEAIIDINDFPRIIRDRNCWFDAFSQLFGFRGAPDVRSMTGLIADGRKFWAHPGKGDVDSEHTRTHLALITDLLEAVNEPDARDEVENIRERLFSHEVGKDSAEAEKIAFEERLTDMSDQLAAAKAEKADLEKKFKPTSDRLGKVEAERIVLAESCKTMSDQLAEVDVKHLEYRKLLEEYEAEQATYEELLGDMWNQVEAAEAEKVELKENLAASEAEKAALKKRLETSSNRLVGMDPEKVSPGDKIGTEVKHEDQATDREFGIQSPAAPVTSAGKAIKLTEEYLVNEGLVEQTRRGYYRLTAHGFETWGQILPVQPILQLISDRSEYRRADIIEMVAEHFSATRDERRILSQNVLVEGYLMNEELIERTRTGYYRITARGIEVLRQNTSRGKASKTNRVREAPRGYARSTFGESTALPTGKEMEQPALEFLSDGREHRRVEIIDRLTEHFSLTGDERSYLSKTGQAEKHLVKEGLIERTRTGYYRITARGRRKVRTG